MSSDLSLRELKITDQKYFAKWWRDRDLIKFTSGRPKLISDKKVDKYFSMMIDGKNDHHFMIILGKKVIGHIALIKKKNNWYETIIIIGEKKYWNKGYGTKAIQMIIKKAKCLGISKIYLEVRPNNLRAIKAYEKCGFKKISLIKHPKNKYLPLTLRMELESTEIPKVKFIEIPINLEVNVIYWFLFQNKLAWEWVIIKRHPLLKTIYKFKKKKERINFLKNYINTFRSSNKKKLLVRKKEFEKAWRKVERELLITLEKVINTTWPSKRKEIKAMVSINPICPRFLDSWSFSISFNYDIGGAIGVIMHEICHFLYFKKWKELFPDSERRTFDYPHIEWCLSELVAPIILNDERIQRLLKQKASFYKEHRRVKIKGISAPKYFSKLYANYIKKNKNFDEFIKEAYRIIKINKKTFLSIGK